MSARAPESAGTAPEPVDQAAVDERPVVLLVDDEPGILAALRRLLRRSPYTVLTAADGLQALEILGHSPVTVVVADYRMPRMNGAELLLEARRLAPDTVRILLTGDADLHVVSDALNKGAIFKFLLKPWDQEGLLRTIEEAVQMHRLARENARLTRELADANSALRRLNTELAQRVEEKARELDRAVYYDALTGLPNRTLLADRLTQSIMHARRSGQHVAVLLLDVDRLKHVNDTLGHDAGDALLEALAGRLERNVRGGDTVARVNGDEFAFVLGDLADEQQVHMVANRILRDVAEPFRICGHEIYLAASIGASIFPGDGTTGPDLLRTAGVALHHAMEEGGGRFHFHAEPLNRRNQRRLTLETQLRRAVERQEFVLHYQPRVDARSGLPRGAEALLRWAHPERGLVPPGEFIPLLEETGLIVPVGEWCLHQAVEALGRFDAAGHDDLSVSVNLSPRQVADADVVDDVVAAFAALARPLPASRLELEITEGLLLRDAPAVHAKLDACHDAGVRIAIDDFGTGYSSLSYLMRFPVDVLKIDRSFVAHVSHARDAETLVKGVLSLAHGLRLTTVAEGVETHAQWSFLRMHGCEELQGYLFSRALPEADFLRYLAGDRKTVPTHGGSD
ncbi:MAG: EAL domain-containing protein [Chromatiales bacterium]|nr:EAL domain-containing protein [Chromatiales bacterium]